jgi:hypothetical protein
MSDMIVGLSILLALGIVAVWLFLRGRRTRDGDAVEPSAPQSYHAVSVTSDSHPCAAVQEVFGQRFLSRLAPLFPVAGCDRADSCTCRYEHFEDRRAGRDRRDVWTKKVQVQGFVDDKRAPRTRKDRRSAETPVKT